MGELRVKIGDIPLLDPRDIENTKSLEEVNPISIHPNHSDFHVMLGTELTEELWNALVEFLNRNYDVIAWSQGNVLGIDPYVTVHKLFTYPNHPPIYQKRMKFAPEQLKVIEEAVLKLINVAVIRESHYLDWLANVIVAPTLQQKYETVTKCSSWR